MKTLLVSFIVFLNFGLSASAQQLIRTVADTTLGTRPTQPDPNRMYTKRTFINTSIYQDKMKLSRTAVVDSFSTSPGSLSRYRWGSILKPIGPVVVLAGVAVGYIALRGTEQTDIIRGIKTAANPNVPDVQVSYTKRKIPLFFAGLGLFAGGLVLTEYGNELIGKSVSLYNAKLDKQRKVAFFYKVRPAITSDGQVALRARL